MKAYLIARVSTEDQIDALSAQVHRLVDYANRYNLDYELIKFQESAYKGNRDEFNTILRRILKVEGLVTLVFDKIDRYTRDSSTKEVRLIQDLYEKGRLELHFVSDNLVITEKSPATDLMRLGLGILLGRYYSDAIRDNVIRRFEQMRRDGLWTGKAPFGYINTVLPDGRKWIEAHPHNANIVRAIYEQYGSGVSSLKLVRQYVKNEYGVGISNAQLDRILHNPFYKGIMRVSGKLYPHNYEIVISEKLNDQVNAVRQGYKIKPTIYAGLPFVYRGLIDCAECGCRITFEQKKKKYVYGHCTQTRGKHGASYVSEDILTKQFKTNISNIAIPERAYREVSKKLKELHETDKQQKTHKLLSLTKEIHKYETRLERMYEDRLDGSISSELYDKKFKEFTNAKQVLENSRDKFEFIAKDAYTSIDHLLRLSRNAPKLFELGKIEQKRQLIKMTHSNLELNGKELRWKYKRPFEMMALCNETSNWLGRRDSNP